MKRFLEKYNRKSKVAMLLGVIYSIHLFTFYVLLFNPNDELSRNSFSDHQSNPHATTNCFLLLAKKAIAKQDIHFDFNLDFLPVSVNAILFPQPVIQPKGTLAHFPQQGNKQYLLLRVLRV
jgi:hypothetical protein